MRRIAKKHRRFYNNAMSDLIKLQCMVCGGLLQPSLVTNHYECRSCQMLYRYEGQQLEIMPPVKQIDNQRWWILRDSVPPYGYRLGYGNRYVQMPPEILMPLRDPGFATYASFDNSTYGGIGFSNFNIRSRFSNIEDRFRRWLVTAMRELKPDLTLEEMEQFLIMSQGGYR